MNSAAEIWLTVLDLLKENLTETSMKTWFLDAEPISLEGDCFTVCCPTELKKNILSTRYAKDVEAVLYELFSEEIFLKVITPDQKDAELTSEPEPDQVQTSIGSYTFDRFVVGSSNRFAYNAARAVADESGESNKYNPLFIYGNPGLGKTHLLYAIYNEVKVNHPEYKCVIVTGELFTNEVTTAIRNGTTEELRAKYRDKDMLLVDDIQFIAGKEATQVEFFNTFNNLYESGHKIILTSDRPPADMVRLEERLRSRFEWGLMVDIQPPEYETRMAIIEEKACQLGLDSLPKAALEFIAENVTGNVRQIEGTVKKLLAYQELQGARMEDTETIMKAVRDMIRSSESFMPSPDLITEETGKAYGVEVNDILSGSRTKEITMARQVAMFVVRQLTKLSLQEIGKYFNRDHTTVIHSLEKVESLMKEDRETAEKIRDITSNVNSHNY